jgi:flagellin-specific chaperone FliS
MAISIINNIPSLVAQNQLSITQSNLQKTLFQLASGLRINSGAELNAKAGGEVARRLADLYDVARGKILEANIKSNKEIIERLSAVLCPVREAGHMVDQKSGQPSEAGATLESAQPSADSANSAKPHPGLRQLQWSAS